MWIFCEVWKGFGQPFIHSHYGNYGKKKILSSPTGCTRKDVVHLTHSTKMDLFFLLKKKRKKEKKIHTSAEALWDFHSVQRMKKAIRLFISNTESLSVSPLRGVSSKRAA